MLTETSRAMEKYYIAHNNAEKGDNYHLGWFLHENETPLFCVSVARQTSAPKWHEDHSTTAYYPEGEVRSKDYKVISVKLYSQPPHLIHPGNK
jgi:hypothetical protein